MTFVSTWPGVAGTLRGARRAIARVLGPSEPGRRISMPSCVSYGRAVFCLHLHAPRVSQARNAGEAKPR